MILKTSLYGKTYEFKDVKEVLAKANEPKSGDVFQGIAAETALERVAAKVVLSHLIRITVITTTQQCVFLPDANLLLNSTSG